MANKQTRRSISVSKTVYDRVRAHCEKKGISMSSFVEACCVEEMNRPAERPRTAATA